jgi:leader peptidase (prepilin peptidase)/N-methyltransferase
VSLAAALAAAAVAAACGWPAAALIGALGVPAGPDGAEPSVSLPPRWLISAVLALLAFAVCARLRPGPVAVAGVWLVLCGVPLAVIDTRVRRLPDVLTLACFSGLLGVLAVAAGLHSQWPSLLRAALGGAALGGLFVLLALTRPGSAGLGDAKLGLSTGALAAWFGWVVLAEAVFAAFALAACCGLILIVAKKAALRSGTLPFGPFLLAGCLIIVMLAGGR